MAGAATTSLKLDAGMKERVQQVATAKRRTPHWVMREAIGEYVEREQRREQMRLDTIASLEHYQRTGLHVTGEEMDAWMERVIAGEDPEMPECHL